MAAGNWLTNAGLGDAAIAIGARTIEVALHASVKNQEIIGHPVIRAMLAQDAGWGQLMGNLGVGWSLAAIGQGKATAVVEGTEATATNYSTANSSLTPARYAYARKASDFARSIQESMLRGEMSPDAYGMLIYEGFRLWGNTFIDSLVALASSATYEIGTTATALTWGEVQDGIIDHKDRGNTGAALGLLSAKGAKDLANDGLALGGAVQWAPQAQSFIADSRSGARLGNFWGVDWYLNSELDADSGDTLGILIGEGALASKHQRVPLPEREARVVADVGLFTIEGRRGGGGVSTFETVFHFATGIKEAASFEAVRYVT